MEVSLSGYGALREVSNHAKIWLHLIRSTMIISKAFFVPISNREKCAFQGGRKTRKRALLHCEMV